MRKTVILYDISGSPIEATTYGDIKIKNIDPADEFNVTTADTNNDVYIAAYGGARPRDRR